MKKHVILLLLISLMFFGMELHADLAKQPKSLINQ
jgi:hypothetical protein